MRIEIAERLKPFSHMPGTSFILPGSDYQVQIFPCLLRIYQLRESFPTLMTELKLDVQGPVQQFTACNDLEKGCISVWGETKQGWMRYHIFCNVQPGQIHLLAERTPLSGLSLYQDHTAYTLQNGDLHSILGHTQEFEPYRIPACDRLSLGNHKAQDVDLIKRRLSLQEILPLWHRLGQLVPLYPWKDSLGGTWALLEECRACMIQGKPEKTEQCWLNLIQAGFSSFLVPRLEDQDFQGIAPPLVSLSCSPLVLLSEGAKLIRQLFIQFKDHHIHFLPHLLPSLSCGRLLDIPWEGGKISLEWTKKTIRRVILYSQQEQEVKMHFRSDVQSYRFRQNLHDKGSRKSCQETLFLHKNDHYLFDNFL